MAGDLNTLNQDVINAENALKIYEDPSALPKIKANVNAAWDPILRSSINVTRDQISNFLPTYMGTPEALGGTSAADLSPTQKLQVMGNKLGQMSGQLYSSTALSDYLGGKLNEMYNNAIQAWQLGNQAAAAAYDRAFQKYQLAWQAEENRKQRAAASGGGGGGWGDFVKWLEGQGGQGGQTIDTDSMNADQLYAHLNQYGNAYDTNTLNNLWAEWRAKAYGNQYRNTPQSEIDANKVQFQSSSYTPTPTGSTKVGKGMYQWSQPTYSA